MLVPKGADLGLKSLSLDVEPGECFDIDRSPTLADLPSHELQVVGHEIHVEHARIVAPRLRAKAGRASLEKLFILLNGVRLRSGMGVIFEPERNKIKIMKIRKAVLPAAGLGTRFLPATKAQPKEMLPLVDKPLIQYVIEEAVGAGIQDVILVTGRGKSAIEDHFDVSFELERFLEEKGKKEELSIVKAISDLVNVCLRATERSARPRARRGRRGVAGGRRALRGPPRR